MGGVDRLQVIWTRRSWCICISCMLRAIKMLGEVLTLLRNYAKTHPDLCILAVNTFVQVPRPTYYREKTS